MTRHAGRAFGSGAHPHLACDTANPHHPRATLPRCRQVPLRPQGLAEQLLPDWLRPSRRSGGLGRGLGRGGCSGRAALVAPDPLNGMSSGGSGGGGSGGGGDGGVDADSELVHVPAL